MERQAYVGAKRFGNLCIQGLFKEFMGNARYKNNHVCVATSFSIGMYLPLNSAFPLTFGSTQVNLNFGEQMLFQ